VHGLSDERDENRPFIYRHMYINIISLYKSDKLHPL